MRSFPLTLLLLSLTLFAHAAIALHGGAANPYAVLLLLPVAIAMLLLPFASAWLITFVVMLGQVLQLLAPLSDQHAMQNHFHSMVYAQLFATALLALTLHYLRQRLRQQQRALDALQQRRARDEQLVAIGTAAAQFSHELATPIQALHLLLDAPQHSSADGRLMQQQVQRLQQLLQDWREVAEDVRSQRHRRFTIEQLLQQLRDAWLLIQPSVSVVWQCPPLDGVLEADRTLLPALLSLLQNAAQASKSGQILVRAEIQQADFVLTVVNQGNLDIALDQLGKQVMASAHGSGIGALVSVATIERFAGSIRWQQYEQSLQTEVRLPLVRVDQH